MDSFDNRREAHFAFLDGGSNRTPFETAAAEFGSLGSIDKSPHGGALALDLTTSPEIRHGGYRFSGRLAPGRSGRSLDI
jgi:hypothetical protein